MFHKADTDITLGFSWSGSAFNCSMYDRAGAKEAEERESKLVSWQAGLDQRELAAEDLRERSRDLEYAEKQVWCVLFCCAVLCCALCLFCVDVMSCLVLSGAVPFLVLCWRLLCCLAALCCAALCCAALCCAVSCCYAVLRCVILRFAVLFCAVLCRAILCYAVLVLHTKWSFDESVARKDRAETALHRRSLSSSTIIFLRLGPKRAPGTHVQSVQQHMLRDCREPATVRTGRCDAQHISIDSCCLSLFFVPRPHTTLEPNEATPA